MPTTLVTGASRGIGLELVKALLARGDSVIAAVRNPDSSTALQQMAGAGGSGAGGAASGGATSRLQIVQLDVGSLASIKACIDGLKHQGITHLDLVVNNAGVLEELRPLEEVSEEDFKHSFQVNTIGPFLVTQQLKVAGLIGQPGTVVANISSILGSIGTDIFQDYPGFAYRSSKAALNSLTKYSDVALASHGVACVAIHPGYVMTDINKGAGHISAEESAGGILQVLASGRDLHGRFYAWNGEELPW